MKLLRGQPPMRIIPDRFTVVQKYGLWAFVANTKTQFYFVGNLPGGLHHEEVRMKRRSAWIVLIVPKKIKKFFPCSSANVAGGTVLENKCRSRLGFCQRFVQVSNRDEFVCLCHGSSGKNEEQESLRQCLNCLRKTGDAFLQGVVGSSERKAHTTCRAKGFARHDSQMVLV